MPGGAAHHIGVCVAMSRLTGLASVVWEVDVRGHLNSLARTVGRVVTCMLNFWNWNASPTAKSVMSLIQLTCTQCVGDPPGVGSHRVVAGEDKANT